MRARYWTHLALRLPRAAGVRVGQIKSNVPRDLAREIPVKEALNDSHRVVSEVISLASAIMRGGAIMCPRSHYQSAIPLRSGVAGHLASRSSSFWFIL